MRTNNQCLETQKTYQERSKQTLERALEKIPFYSAWQELDPGPTVHIDARFAAMPVLTKADIREHFPLGFVPRDIDIKEALRRRDVELIETGGTTAEKVTNYWNQLWWNKSEQASWQIHPDTRRWANGTHREAILTSSYNVGPISDTDDLNFAERRLGRFLYLNEKTSPLLWEAYHFERMIEDLTQYNPEILEANPSYLWRLCRFAIKHNIKIQQPRVIVFTYERPMMYQLHFIRQVFDCPLISSYGTTELGYVFMQCQEGRFHQNTEFCRVDYQPLNGEEKYNRGRILVTTFGNAFYQIMRFDPGDIVRLADKPCSCGRQEGLVLEDIEGRFSQTTLNTSGGIVTMSMLDKAMFEAVGPCIYELIQEKPRDYRARFEASVNASQVKTALKNLYGRQARIVIESGAEIPPSLSGKFRHAWMLFDLTCVFPHYYTNRRGGVFPPE